MTRKKMNAATAALHAWRLWLTGHLRPPDDPQMFIPGMELPPKHPGPRLLPFLLGHLAQPSGKVVTSRAQVAAAAGVDGSTVTRWRGQLVDRGFLVMIAKGNRHSPGIYWLAVPEWAVPQLLERFGGTFDPAATKRTQMPPVDRPRQRTQMPPVDPGDHGLESASEVLESASDGSRERTQMQPTRDTSKRRTNKHTSDMGRTPNPCKHGSEVKAACDLLAELMIANGCRKPRITCKGWHDPIDRMHRLDGRTWEEITGAIRWAQGHDFWCSRIMSPAKLRTQFDQMRLQARRDSNGSGGKPSAGMVASSLQLAQQMAAESGGDLGGLWGDLS